MSEAAVFSPSALARVEAWFAGRGWAPFDFQRAAWAAYGGGRSGLIHAPTGMGKTQAAWLGPVLEWMTAHPDYNPRSAAPPLSVMWITPLRALAKDTVAALNGTCAGLGLPWTVELRTGDTSSHIKQRQRKRPPTALVTTPESLSLLLSYADTERQLRHLRCVIVDEWHELLGSKRGVQTELALARLRRWLPDLRTWGLSATLGNLDQALAVLVGGGEQGLRLGHREQSSPSPILLAGDASKEVAIQTLMPPNMERFPWAGHLGVKLLPQVVERVLAARTTLIFTNTRAQTELWFQALIDYAVTEAPELIGAIGLHHGSLEPKLRQDVEARLADGRLRCVVCTSSLDLGVDFAPVDQVMQVGSPKGVARLLQRAGRSGHQPGGVSRVLCVPTHAFELVEFTAARDAIARGEIEARQPLAKPLDVLVQHLVTVALGSGFAAAGYGDWVEDGETGAKDNIEALPGRALFDEVCTTYAYRDLTQPEWLWALDFVTFGGAALKGYQDYARVQLRNGQYRVLSPQNARRHRMSIGAIASDGMLDVRFQSGGALGAIEESFVARLKPGDTFIFAGRLLEFRRIKDMTVQVRKATQSRGVVPRWQGGRMPLSSHLADAVRLRLATAEVGIYDTPEMQAVQPILAIQQRWSRIPAAGELLIEAVKTREGHHLFLYPLAGYQVHEGLASLLAYRLSQQAPRTISAFATDYGCELLSPTPMPIDEAGWRQILSTENLLADILLCLNAAEMARRQFRDIARVAGLIFSGYPGSQKTTRQIQASSSVIYDAMVKYDPDNLLLDQARREVLERQLDFVQLQRTLEGIAGEELVLTSPRRLTPMAFPLWASRLRSQISSETWSDRVARMVMQLEKAAG
ncbi:MAG: ligase-associated DNA damage response DEXH box helicase [Caldilineaceae bacterium]